MPVRCRRPTLIQLTPLSGGAPKDAGDYTVVGKFTSNLSGYTDATTAPVHFSISQASAIISISGLNVTYDGRPHPALATAQGVARPTPINLTSLLHVSYSTTAGNTFTTTAPVTPGNYEIYYTFDGNVNYLAVDSETDSGKAVVIGRAAPKLTASHKLSSRRR
jgi:hypothetical protein